MWIQKLVLQTAKLDENRHFYTDILQCRLISESPTDFSIRMGQTELRFEANPNCADGYHFALNIPHNQFEEAKVWIMQRVSLIADSTGRDNFNFTSWNAHSLYFYDSAGNVVEFIARHDLPSISTVPFTIASVIGISEIGLAADEPLATAAQLLAGIEGLGVFRGEQSETFNALGTDNGILIIVKTEREWYPESRRYAAKVPITIVLRVEDHATYRLEIFNDPIKISRI